MPRQQQPHARPLAHPTRNLGGLGAVPPEDIATQGSADGTARVLSDEQSL